MDDDRLERVLGCARRRMSDLDDACAVELLVSEHTLAMSEPVDRAREASDLAGEVEAFIVRAAAPHEARALRHLFGLNGAAQLTSAEYGELFGYTRGYASTCREHAIRTLRAASRGAMRRVAHGLCPGAERWLSAYDLRAAKIRAEVAAQEAAESAARSAAHGAWRNEQAQRRARLEPRTAAARTRYRIALRIATTITGRSQARADLWDEAARLYAWYGVDDRHGPTREVLRADAEDGR